MSVSKVASDEMDYQRIVTTPATEFPVQRIVIPSSSNTMAPGGSVVFEYNEKTGNSNTIINALMLKYRIQNTTSSGSTITIPIWGIWGLIEQLKLYVNGVLIKTWDQRILRYIYMSNLTDHGSIRNFLNNRIGTANIANLANLTDARTLTSGSISPYYVSNFREVLDSFFKFRAVSFFDKIQIEIQMISDTSAVSTARCLGIGATGSALSDIVVRDLQLILDLSPYPSNVNILTNSFKSEILLNYPYRVAVPVTANSAGTYILNLNTQFPPLNCINRLYLWWHNSALGSGLTSANSFAIFNCSYFTKIIVKRNGVQQFILEDSEIYNEPVRYEKNRGINLYDSFYTSSQYLTNAPTLFVNLSKDKLPYSRESSTSLTQNASGISNQLSNGLWTVEISYDLTSAPTYLDTLNLMIESAQIVCLYANNKKLPTITY